jgi:hypothetical protein
MTDWSEHLLICRQALHRTEQALLQRNLLLGCTEALKARAVEYAAVDCCGDG